MLNTINDINKLLSDRMEFLRLILKNYVKYSDHIKEVFMGMDPDMYNKSQNDIVYITEKCSEIPTILTNDQYLLNGSKLYDQFEPLEGAVDELLCIMKNVTYLKLSSYSISPSTIQEITHLKKNTINYYDKYKKKSIDDDIIIINSIITLANVSKDESFRFIVDNKNIINKFTIKLIGHIINDLSSAKKRELEIFVEQQKDSIMGAIRVDISSKIGIQGLMVRYGLVPGLSCEISEIFDQIGAKYDVNSSLDNNLRSAALNNGIILINISNKSPLEFNIKSITDSNYIKDHDLETTAASGLTKKIINKYKTTTMLTPNDVKGKKMVKYPGKHDKWYIIETINGTLYRLLSYQNAIIIDGNRIVGLLNGLSTRCFNYNNIQANVITTKCINKKLENLVSEYDDNFIGNVPGYIAPAINNKLIDYFNEQLKSGAIKSISDFDDVVLNEAMISDIILKTLPHTSGVSSKGALEYTITYIARINFIIDQFMKELMRQLNRHPIDKKIFKESHTSVHKELQAIYKLLIDKTIAEITKIKLFADYDMTLKEYYMDKRQIVI